MADMNIAEAHAHATNRHHEGLVLGTILGSCVVTTFAAVVMAITNPSVILHPSKFTSELSVNSSSSQQAATAGVAADSAQSVFDNGRQLQGLASQATINNPR